MRKSEIHRPVRLTGNERPEGADCRLRKATVRDFWQWAFSDLCSNDIRGVFAEWLVAKLLNIDLRTMRDSWAHWDLVTVGISQPHIRCCILLEQIPVTNVPMQDSEASVAALILSHPRSLSFFVVETLF